MARIGCGLFVNTPLHVDFRFRFGQRSARNKIGDDCGRTNQIKGRLVFHYDDSISFHWIDMQYLSQIIAEETQSQQTSSIVIINMKE